jgi:NADH:ubiquinone oxidoreductase subunit 6 (subunit J)
VSLYLFYILGGIILICALMVVTLKNVFHSALFLVLAFFFVAGIYLMLSAEFLAAVQVLIYVGAITILILFAIMLTYQIQSASVRQVNEQVIPAVIIAGLFFVLASTALVRTFGGGEPAPKNTGFWSASVEAGDLYSGGSQWHWTANIRDTLGGSYGAIGSIKLINPKSNLSRFSRPAPEFEAGYGYVISDSPDFSTTQNVFPRDQMIYLKIWSDNVDYKAISNAVWILSVGKGETHKLTIKLSNSNTETIGRLLMSKFVLPFEVVSVLLLAALVGAIIIARRDN